MTHQEEDYVRDVLKFFYPTSGPLQTITPDLAELAARMLKEALEQSKALDLVPRPPGFIPGPTWLLSQAVEMFWRTHGKRSIYDTARAAVAFHHRGEFDVAKQTGF